MKRIPILLITLTLFACNALTPTQATPTTSTPTLSPPSIPSPTPTPDQPWRIKVTVDICADLNQDSKCEPGEDAFLENLPVMVYHHPNGPEVLGDASVSHGTYTLNATVEKTDVDPFATIFPEVDTITVVNIGKFCPQGIRSYHVNTPVTTQDGNGFDQFFIDRLAIPPCSISNEA